MLYAVTVMKIYSLHILILVYNVSCLVHIFVALFSCCVPSMTSCTVFSDLYTAARKICLLNVSVCCFRPWCVDDCECRSRSVSDTALISHKEDDEREAIAETGFCYFFQHH